MPSVHLNQVSFHYSSATDVIRDAALDLGPGWVGVVGANGMGKSTLLRLVAGELEPTSGSVDVQPNGAPPVYCAQEVGRLDASVRALAAAWDGASRRIRGELDLDEAQLDRWPTLSPGERKRWQIGAALAVDPPVLLLDEPTNHLDAEARELLVAALGRFRGVGLVVSHDRTFLNELTERTLRVTYGVVELWNGNYETARRAWEMAAAERVEQYQRVKAEQRKLQRRAADQRRATEARRAQHRRSVRQAGPKDRDARSMEKKGRAQAGESAGARQLEVTQAAADRAAEELSSIEMRREVGKAFEFEFEAPRRRVLLSFEGDLSVEGVTLAVGADVALERGDRVWVRGPNGAGKTILLAALAEGHGLPPERVRYLPQELRPGAAEELMADLLALPPVPRGRVLNIVASLGVDPDRLLVTDAPSPGEARKLAMAMGMGRSAWCLLLDEPTNHLDLPSIERLEAAVVGYPGAVLLVTHDEEFAMATTTIQWVMGDGRLRVER